MDKLDLPSERKFGSFFSLVLILLASYLLFSESLTISIIIYLGSFVLGLITFFIPIVLRPLNKLWMKLGLVIGMVVSPLVLVLIYFIIITPLSIFLRITGRDELRLKCNSDKSYWIDTPENNVNFDKQY